jgi:hypothetical protein
VPVPPPSKNPETLDLFTLLTLLTLCEAYSFVESGQEIFENDVQPPRSRPICGSQGRFPAPASSGGAADSWAWIQRSMTETT